MAIGIVTAIAALTQAGIGAYQSYQGRKQAKEAERPDYVIPQEAYDQLNDAEIMAMEGLPADQKRVYIENIQRNTQQRVNQLQDRKAGLAGLGAIGQNEMDAYRNLLGMDATARQQNMAGLQGARGTMMNQKAAELGYDMALFQDTAKSAQAMKGAGIQNIMGAIQGAGNTYSDYQKYQDMLNYYQQQDSAIDATTKQAGTFSTAPQQQGQLTPDQQSAVNQWLIGTSSPDMGTATV